MGIAGLDDRLKRALFCFVVVVALNPLLLHALHAESNVACEQPGRHLPIAFSIGQLLNVSDLGDATFAINLRRDETGGEESRRNRTGGVAMINVKTPAPMPALALICA